MIVKLLLKGEKKSIFVLENLFMATDKDVTNV